MTDQWLERVDSALDRFHNSGLSVREVADELRDHGPVTDAEILAGLNAELHPHHHAPDLTYYAMSNITRMRAVLEAAYAVTKP